MLMKSFILIEFLLICENDCLYEIQLPTLPTVLYVSNDKQIKSWTCFHNNGQLNQQWIWTWISNYIHIIMWDVIVHPCINSLAPGKFEWNFGYMIFKQILVIEGWGICCEIALIWMSLDFTDDQSTLVQVMAWCRQPPSHYLSQCWLRSLLPYVVTKPQWVNSSPPKQNDHHFADNIFKCICVNEKFCISIWISLKFVPKGPIANMSALVRVMALG